MSSSLVATRYASAIGISNSGPSFGKSAGASDTTIFTLLCLGALKLASFSNVEFFNAALTRSRDSSTALSGRPTIENEWRPFAVSISTLTMCASRRDTCALKSDAKDIACIVTGIYIENVSLRSRCTLKPLGLLQDVVQESFFDSFHTPRTYHF